MMRLSFPTLHKGRYGYNYKQVFRQFLSSSSKLNNLGPKKKKTKVDNLYSRISPVGDPSESMVPILDQWVQEGRPVHKEQLVRIIKELRIYRRYKHALEISQWMSDKRYMPLSIGDFVMRLNLITQVHGLEQAENYFNIIPEKLKGSEVYYSLLNCYAQAKSIEKAEAIMQEIKNFGYVRSPLCYNILMNLYYKTGHMEKLDSLMHEMENQGIHCDEYTLGIRLSAYAAASDVEGMDRILMKMESNRRVVPDWNSYAIAADGYVKVGLVDKALAMLKKVEEKMITAKNMNVAFDFLLKSYARAGKNELYRIWTLYKDRVKIYNKGYLSMISSLLKFDDTEGAEKIFEEWRTKNLSYDFRIPNCLVDAYCKTGLLEKSEALINQAIAEGGKPSVDTWYYMANGYLVNNQIPKAVEMIRKAILAHPSGPKPSKEMLTTCLEYLEGKGDMERADEFIKKLQVEGIFSADVHDILLSYIKEPKSQSNAIGQTGEVVLVGDG